MNGAAPIQCVNCGIEQPFERIYCAHCGCSLDAAKPLGQTWAGTFLVILLFFVGSTAVGFALILLMFSEMEESLFGTMPIGEKIIMVGMWVLAACCGWGIWRLARR